MRTHATLTAIALMGLLLWAAAPHVHAQDPPETPGDAPSEEKEVVGEVEEKPKKEKTTEIEEEKDVMILHANNFARALKESRLLLVEFYAPWCGHCQKLEPLYAEAATRLKGRAATRLAKVEATEEAELASEFGVTSFPALKLFVDGERTSPVDYTGRRTTEGIVQWMSRRAGPGPAVLETPEAAAELLNAHNLTVVGFFNSLEGVGYEVFSGVYLDLVEVEFAVTSSPAVMEAYGVEGGTVVLLKKFDDPRADYRGSGNGTLDREELMTFIKTNSLELIIAFSEQNGDKIFGSQIQTHSLLFLNASDAAHSALLEEYRTAAREFRGKVLFVTIDVTANLSHVLTYFGVTEADAPTVRIISTDKQKKFAMGAGAITAATLRTFCQGVLDGTLQPNLLSQEIPEDWNKGPVAVLVGKNFDQVVFDDAKNVFVEFYAPWCGHCKELAPVWEKLGEKYADRDDVIIAKMDATTNEVESVEVHGFPTLKFFPAGEKKEVTFNGKRDLDTLSKFVESGGVLPAEENKEDEDDDDEEYDEEEDDEDEDVTDDSSQTAANETSRDEL